MLYIDTLHHAVDLFYLKAAVGAALGDGGLYPARLAMGGGAGYGTALEALRDGSGRCTRRGA